MAPARIMLAALPHLLEEIVSDALDRHGLEVVGATQSVDELPETVARTLPDLVVLGRDDPTLALELLQHRPRLKVLAVAKEGQDSWLYERLGALSPATLVEAVQRAVSPPTTPWSPT